MFLLRDFYTTKTFTSFSFYCFIVWYLHFILLCDICNQFNQKKLSIYFRRILDDRLIISLCLSKRLYLLFPPLVSKSTLSAYALSCTFRTRHLEGVLFTRCPTVFIPVYAFVYLYGNFGLYTTNYKVEKYGQYYLSDEFASSIVVQANPWDCKEIVVSFFLYV